MVSLFLQVPASPASFASFTTSSLLRFISCHRLSLSTRTALSSSLILFDICSFCSHVLCTILVKFSSIDALLSTNGVASGGGTLFVPGSLVLVEARAVPLCLEGPSKQASSFPSVVPDPVTLVVPHCMFELVIAINSLDCCIPLMFLYMALTEPN